MKKLLFIGALIFFTAAGYGQDEEKPEGSLKDKLFAGGSLGLSFGSYTLINLSPQIGYRFNKYLSSGVGFNLIYASQKERLKIKVIANVHNRLVTIRRVGLL